jgi:adenylyl-sulfate kinase
MKPVLWLFGLPSSGKTTLANALRDHFRSQNRPVILLDGDELRSGLCADLGFSDAERSKNIRRVAHLARWLAARGNTVICAFVTPREDHRALALEILGDTLRLIHVNCPLEVCTARDVKGLYARAAAGQMNGLTGTQAPFEPPPETVLSVKTAHGTISEALERLLAALKEP